MQNSVSRGKVRRPGLEITFVGGYGLAIHVGLMTVKTGFPWGGSEYIFTGSLVVPEFTSSLKPAVDIQLLSVDKVASNICLSV